VLCKEGRQRGRPRLLFSFDEEVRPRPWPGTRTVQGPDSSNMHEDSGLVIGRAPAPQASIPHHSIKRGTLPFPRRPRRLDVVVGIEQHREACRERHASRRRPPVPPVRLPGRWRA
jgi:hypothetical protein